MGRKPGLKLNRDGEEIGLSDWLLDVLDDMQALAEKIDGATRTTNYSKVLKSMEARARQVEPYTFSTGFACFKRIKSGLFRVGHGAKPNSGATIKNRRFKRSQDKLIFKPVSKNL